MTGKIDKTLPDSGYGFITPDAGHSRKGVFFHVSGMADRELFAKLKKGDAVTYEQQDHEKGPRAVNVRLA